MQNKPTPTISLNGHRYNAISGEPVDDSPPILQPHNIDGVLSAPQSTAKKVTIHQAKRKPAPSASPVGHHPHRSKTLSRQAVQKPQPSKSLISQASAPITDPDLSIKLPQPIGTIDPKAAKRAASIKLSPKISRFNIEASSQTAPATRSIPEQHRIDNAAHQARSAAKTTKADIFEQAIERAQPAIKTAKDVKQHKRPLAHKVTGYVAAGILLLAGLGYVAYQNIPNIMTKVASIDAGISASMPSYRPAGYTLNKVAYAPGTVKFIFTGNSDNRSYTLSEHQSTWDSATLVSNIINPVANNKYTQMEVDGQIIYFYGNQQAAWVNNNILFEVTSNGNLSTNQLIKMATSL